MIEYKMVLLKDIVIVSGGCFRKSHEFYIVYDGGTYFRLSNGYNLSKREKDLNVAYELVKLDKPKYRYEV